MTDPPEWRVFSFLVWNTYCYQFDFIQKNAETAAKMGDTGKLFLEFLASRRSDLLRISRNTRGEYSETDLHGVAWEMLALIRRRQGRSINLSCKDDQELILRWVYSEVVHFDETHIRKAVRLDQDWNGVLTSIQN